MADIAAPEVDRVTDELVSGGECNQRDQCLPSQNERMGIVLASRCLNALREESSVHSDLTSTGVGDTSTISRENSAISREIGAISRENSRVYRETSAISQGTSAFSRETTAMHLDLRSYSKCH